MWQSIETAPKDGTEILVVVNGQIYLTWWEAEPFADDDAYWLDTGGSCPTYECFRTFDSESEAPTHWMPLPSLPE